jgi:hypothetical protein
MPRIGFAISRHGMDTSRFRLLQASKMVQVQREAGWRITERDAPPFQPINIPILDAPDC